MTTPDTSAVRAWARENGYEVADRGRLPAGVTQAYLAATKSKRTPAKKAPAKRAATKHATAERVSEPARERQPSPKPSPVTDDRRLVALGEEIAALTRRVEALEKAGPAAKAGKPRFRRRS